jgi:long-chain acyl-CoA synthetase
MGVIQKLKSKLLDARKAEAHVYEDVKEYLTHEGDVQYLGHLLRHASARYASRVALIFAGKSIIYHELYYRSLLLSKKLQDAGVKRGDRVLMLFPNSMDFYVAYFAIAQIGAVLAPLNVFLHERELGLIINDAKPQAFVYAREFEGLISATKAREGIWQIPVVFSDEQIDWQAQVPASFSEDALGVTIDSLAQSEVCLLLYTSGTTGVPKGVMLSSKNMTSNIMQVAARLIMNGILKTGPSSPSFVPERPFAALPLFHVFAQSTCVLLPIAFGHTIIVVPKVDRVEILEGLNYAPTMFIGVPALYGLLCLLKTAPLNSVRIFISGGDAISDKIRSAFAMIYGRKISTGYGLTEASPVIAFNLENKEYATNVVGKPLLGIECEIRAEDGQVVSSGSVGDLWVRGDNVMLGYYNAQAQTDAVLRDGWLNTGDLATVDADGVIAIIGRSKDLIIHKGFNIYPQEIENVLLSHAAVFKAAIVGKEDASAGQVPIAFISLKTQDENIEAKLREYCKNNLASYKIPRKFIYLDDLPMTATGKIDKTKLLIK